MADDIKIKLGLDAAELFAGLNKVTTELNQVQGESKQAEQSLDKVGDTDLKGAAADADKLAASLDGVGTAAEGAGGILGGLQAGLTDAFSGGLVGSLLGGGIAAGVQAGVGAIVDGFGAVVDAGRGLISAQGDLQAQTGATGAEFEALKAAADEAFLGGVGESVAEATKVISNAKVVLKDALPTEEIGEFTARAQALGNLYDKDVNEVISKSAPFIKQFGLDGDQAFNLIALAAKEGKTSQDDVLDTLAEYSQLLDEAGFSAEEFTGALVVAGQEGLFNTDKIADSIKEAQIRLKAGDTAKAFTDIKNQLPAALGSTLGNLEKLASSGQITIKEFLAKSGESIKTAFDSGQISEAMATQLQVAVAGTPAEDIGVEAYNKLFGAPIPTGEITKKATEAGQAAQNAVGQYLVFDSIGRNLSLAFEKSSAAIMSAINSVAAIVIPIFTETLGPIFDQFGGTVTSVFENIWSVVKPILAVIGGAIIANIVIAINAVMVVLDTLYSIWNSTFDALKRAVQPVIDAISRAFGSDGEMGESLDVVKLFTDALSFVTEIMREVGGVIADVGGFIIELLIAPFEILIDVIVAVVDAIADWIGENEKNNESIKQTGKEAENSGGWIDWLRRAFDNIRGTLGGVREAFTVVKDTLGEFFSALATFDIQKALNAFSGFGEKLSDSYDKGFNKTKEAIEATRAAEKKAEAEKEAAEKQAATKTAASTSAKVASAKKSAQAESFAKLDELKKFYETEAKEIENANIRTLRESGLQGEELKKLQTKLDIEAQNKLKEYLNDKIGRVKDASVLLNKEQLTAVLKPASPKQMLDLETFYLKEMDKLSKITVIEPKVKIGAENDKEIQGQLNGLIKKLETQSEATAKSLGGLIPIDPVKTQKQLDEVQASFASYQNYVKGQAVEIQAALDVAIGLGDAKAQQQLENILAANDAAIADTQKKLDTFNTKSKKAIEENQVQFQIGIALQTSILDAFNSERIAKEREANEALRAEKLGALDQEENDLTTSLAKREVSFEEYAAKMADIDKARQDAMEATEVTFAERLKEVQDKTIGSLLRSQSKAITDFVEEQFKDSEGKVTANGKIIGESMTALTTQFATLAESGKATLGDFGNAAAAVAFDAVSKMIPSFVAGILGSSITALGPIAGPIAAGLLTASLQLLLGQAKAALGFKDGVIDLEGPGTETSDSIPAWLSKGESVITASSTRANKEELAWMNANPGMSIRDYFTSHAPQVRYSVGEDGGLIREVQKLREETRGLGRQINRNTHVSISGELKADNNSIKAVIESERRRNARRG